MFRVLFTKNSISPLTIRQGNYMAVPVDIHPVNNAPFRKDQLRCMVVWRTYITPT